MGTAKLGFWLAIAALVLAIPFGIIGNLLTPILKNWWARRSVIALGERIAELEGSLKNMDGFAPITGVEDEILNTLMNLELFIGMALTLVVAVVGLMVTEEIPERALRSGFITIGTVVAVMFMRTALFSETYSFMRRRSPKARRALETGIAKLKFRLSEKTRGSS